MWQCMRNVRSEMRKKTPRGELLLLSRFDDIHRLNNDDAVGWCAVEVADTQQYKQCLVCSAFPAIN